MALIRTRAALIEGLQLVDGLGLRHRWIRRGVEPGKAKTLAQKMAEWNWKDPSLHYKIDIGFARPVLKRSEVLEDRLKIRREIKQNLELEKAAKVGTLSVSSEDVFQESLKTNRSDHLLSAGEHFSVYQDLFEDAFFVPVTPLDIRFSSPDGVESRVFAGNQIMPIEASSQPQVSYPAKKDSYYTLCLSSPDTHLSGEGNKEYLHWLVGNIPGSSLKDGEELCSYMQPFPFRGIGSCRYIFVLYKQEKGKLKNLQKYQRSKKSTNLVERTFSTYDFYRENQDEITPAGLAFFQSNWDQSLTNFFHNVLEMKEPIFEYDFPEKGLKPQEWFPHREPFNIYLDKYKDPQQLGKELLLEKLKERHPFKPPPTPPKYPLAHPLPPTMSSWQRDDVNKRRVREGKWRFM